MVLLCVGAGGLIGGSERRGDTVIAAWRPHGES